MLHHILHLKQGASCEFYIHFIVKLDLLQLANWHKKSRRRRSVLCEVQLLRMEDFPLSESNSCSPQTTPLCCQGTIARIQPCPLLQQKPTDDFFHKQKMGGNRDLLVWKEHCAARCASRSCMHDPFCPVPS